MRKESIKTHLKEYSIYNKRKTTINHAFASALSVPDDYDEKLIDEVLIQLGQNPDKDLTCCYRDRPAQTWDHIYGLVKNGEFSGYGHQIGNLLPCCRKCNSKKGNKQWEKFLDSKIEDDDLLIQKKMKISNHIKKNTVDLLEVINELTEELAEYNKIKEMIFDLMRQADGIASDIRVKVKKKKREKYGNL